MSNININLNLSAFLCGIKEITGKSGIAKKCLIIPIEDNYLISGKNGVYANLIAFELKERKADSKDTHLIKQSFSQEQMAKFSDEEKKIMPIFGNLTDWSKVQKINKAEDLPDVIKTSEGDDLPF